MNDSELAWLAGILEGEGTFSIRNTNPRNRGISIRCSMTDTDVVERIFELTGIGGITKVKPREEHHKQQTLWAASKRSDVVDLITRLKPWMGRRRQAKIEDMLKFDADNPITVDLRLHGTRAMYEHRKCRCGPCRAAAVKYQMDWRRNVSKKESVAAGNSRSVD